MKKLAILLAAGAGLLTFKTADAQIGLHVNLNFGAVAARVVVPAPVRVVQDDYYDNSDDYYYLPDVEAYYSVPQHCYYYNDGGRWVSAAYLPGRYHDFDWRSARHYEVRAPRPYMHHDEYRNRFGGFNQPRGGGFDNKYANRGGFDHNRGGFDNRGNDNRGWNNDNRGGQFNAPNRGGNYGQPQNNTPQQDHGNYGQPANSNGGQYQNNGQQGRGNYGQPANNNQNGGQQGQGRGNYGGQPQGQGSQNQGQPNQNGGQSRGGNRNDEHFAANRMGMGRPSRF